MITLPHTQAVSNPLLPLLWPQLTAQLLDVDVDGAVVVLLLL